MVGDEGRGGDSVGQGSSVKAQFRLNASPVESHRKASAGGALIRFLTCSTETSLEAVSGDGD